MPKFTAEENKRHWDEYAKQHRNAPEGASYDSNLVELENHFIISELKKIKPRRLLDVGCGNGQRTVLFSRYVKGPTLGIDYSEKMIEQAKKLGKKDLRFEYTDLTNYQTDSKYDVIVSCRSIINQSTIMNQVKLFKFLHSILKPKGHLLIAEASVEGLRNLNLLRSKFNLEPIEEHWFNLHIKEGSVFPKIKHLFQIKKIRRLGLFYFIARVLHPAIVYPKEAKRQSIINEIAKKTQLIFLDSDTTYEKYGRHLLIHFQKK